MDRRMGFVILAPLSTPTEFTLFQKRTTILSPCIVLYLYFDQFLYFHIFIKTICLRSRITYITFLIKLLSYLHHFTRTHMQFRRCQFCHRYSIQRHRLKLLFAILYHLCYFAILLIL